MTLFKMGLSRQTRIITLLIIDTAFFFLELITGYMVGSLALVADSFHMLNDVLSLVVALYTIKLATEPSSSANSYGWQRAEILGALINGVFLIALCVDILVQAIGRFVSPEDISNPKMIVVVGSFGLLSNMVGILLFHEHSHSHGHSHGPTGAHGPIHLPENDEEENAATDVEPIGVPRRQRSESISSLYQHPAETRAHIIEEARQIGYSYEQESVLARSPREGLTRFPSNSRRDKAHESRRNETEEASEATSTSTSTVVEEPTEVPSSTTAKKNAPSRHEDGHGFPHSDADVERGVTLPPGHSGGSMNMRGVFLHVLGDALGNVGVIAAGLVIWFCTGDWTLYFDPMISLLITCIILTSALPLVKSASIILLQGVPSNVSLDAVRDSIKDVDGVVSVHELHVWQLSETTIVASVHVLIVPGSDYMEVANNIRYAMHSHGIHSVTIQPEFSEDLVESEDGERNCLIRCPPEQCVGDTCCPPPGSGAIDHSLANVDEVSERSNSR